MNGGEIDKYPVAQLESRYELVRSAVYTRMKQLGIKPHKVGNKAYITGQELATMDALHRFINETGGSAAEFVEARGLNQPDAAPGTDLSVSGGDMGRFLNVMSEMLLRSQPAPDPIKPYADLEQAARNGWILKTSDLAYLLDLPPGDIQRAGDRFQDAGFTFTRVGFRRGGEAGWRVSKGR